MRPRALVVLLAALYCASCRADPARFVPAPPAPGWARALLVIIEGGDVREGVALELPADRDETIRVELPAGIEAEGVEVHALAYPHPLKRLGIAPGPLGFAFAADDALTRTVPAAAISSRVVLPETSWSTGTTTPDHLLTLRLALAPLGPDEVLLASAGEQFTCAAIDGREVRCWGDNENGKLGSAGFTATSTPASTARPIAAIRMASGLAHSCAVERAGAVSCWGNPEHARLGRAGVAQGSIPAPADGIDDAVDVALGDNHTCALRASGKVLCWGNDEVGQLGFIADPAEPLSFSPVEVPGLPLPAVELGAGGSYSCARLADGSVWCWGEGTRGELGDGGGEDRALPSPVAGLTGAVAAGFGRAHGCAELADGEVRCWGDNAMKQLGPDAPDRALTPVVVAIPGEGRLVVAQGATCRLSPSGALRCFGRSSPIEADDPIVEPARLAAAGELRALSCSPGSTHCCATGRTSGLWCWGWNGAGQLGAPAVPFRATPFTAPGLEGVRGVAAGTDVTCALRSDGTAACFGSAGLIPGSNNFAQANPLELSLSAERIEELALGGQHACARTSSAAPLLCWGSNDRGQLGDGSQSAQPRPPEPIAGTRGAHGISAGSGHTCALDPAGEVLCWGSNADGQLGDGTTEPAPGVVRVVGLPAGGARQVSVGNAHTCALSLGRQVWCWGYSGNAHLLGLGTRLWLSAVPVQVPELEGAVELACRNQHCCARLAAGTVQCWGSDDHGQLGDGEPEAPPGLVTMSGVGDAVALALGESITCVLQRGGTVSCAGLLPRGGAVQSVAEAVPGLDGAVAISAGNSHVCAATAAGKLACWGSDRLGQLGTGARVFHAAPTRVPGLEPR